jgi:hypothetical protein
MRKSKRRSIVKRAKIHFGRVCDIWGRGSGASGIMKSRFNIRPMRVDQMSKKIRRGHNRRCAIHGAY